MTSPGRATEPERFVRDFLRYHGARVEGPPHGPFAAELPPPLARRLGGRRLECVFRVQDLGRYPNAKLMAPGSPPFDDLLRIARRGGGVSRRCLMRDQGREPRACLPDAGPLAAAELGEPAYRSELLFTFRIAYRAFDGFDDIRSIAVAPATGRAEDGGNFFLHRNLAEEPEVGIAPPPPLEIKAALGAALSELERRIGHDVTRFAEQAEAELELQTERLREFYLALIAEEKDRRERRGEPQAVAATGRKIEWVQHVDREIRLFAPRVTVTLLGIEELWIPVCRLTLKSPQGAVEGEIDLATGRISGFAL